MIHFEDKTMNSIVLVKKTKKECVCVENLIKAHGCHFLFLSLQWVRHSDRG